MEGSLLGKWLVIIGIAITTLGGIVWLLGKTGLSFGHLPGDMHVQRESYSIYAPLVTSLIASVVLTLIINVLLWVFRK